MKIQFTRSGGFAGIRTSATLDLDDLSPADRVEIQRLVEQAGFFDLPHELTSPRPDAFQYHVAIESEGGRHEIRVDDRSAPAALRLLLQKLTEIARTRAAE